MFWRLCFHLYNADDRKHDLGDLAWGLRENTPVRSYSMVPGTEYVLGKCDLLMSWC